MRGASKQDWPTLVVWSFLVKIRHGAKGEIDHGRVGAKFEEAGKVISTPLYAGKDVCCDGMLAEVIERTVTPISVSGTSCVWNDLYLLSFTQSA
jgi:hypothetical protein